MATITVEGTRYELPAFDTFSLKEWRVMQRYSNYTVDRIYEVEGMDAGVIAGLLAIAIKRSTTLTEREIDEMVDVVKMTDVMEEFAAELEAEEDPTQGGQPPVEDDSKTSSEGSTASSGNGGSDASALSPELSNPASTGQPDSETGAVSDPMTLVP